MATQITASKMGVGVQGDRMKRLAAGRMKVILPPRFAIFPLWVEGGAAGKLLFLALAIATIA